MRKIIGLYGIGRSGKATTLNLLISKFSDTFKGDSPQLISIGRGRSKRVSFVMNGTVFCIATQGDGILDIEESCSFFKDSNFNIAITATRSKGESCKKLVTFAREQGTTIEWIAKKRDTLNKGEVNKEQAQELFDLLYSSVINY